MAKLLGTIVVLALAPYALALNLNDILGMQEAPRRNLGEPEVVEIIRWRQPVCLTPAKGVKPCVLGLKQAPSKYEKTSESDQKSVKDAKDRIFENNEDEKSAGSIDNKLLSPEVVDSVSIDELEPSSLNNSNEESQERILSLKSSIPEEENVGSEDSRQGKYLVLSGRGRNVASKPPPIYVTKIRDSPVVATLVAYNCLPDIGIPLCDDVVIDSKPFQYSLNLQFPTKPSYVSHKPVNEPDDNSSCSSSSDNESEESANFWEDPNSPHYDDGKPNESSSKPPAIQAIHDYINKPDVVSANGKPEVKPVLVVEPTPKPGLFGGLWRPGFWNKPTATAKPNVVVIQHQNPPVYIVEHKPSKPALVEVAEKPNLNEIIYKPENDISNRPGLFDLFSKPTNEKPPTIARPTEKPGIFGGLWNNPIRPEDPDQTFSSAPSIFNGLPNIFTKPTSKPLIIDRPDDKPLLVEKPVYVVEKPVIPTLTNIFRPEGTTALDNKDHEVIKDPVYVYQKPAQHPGIFGGVFGASYSTTPTTAKPGIFDGWNIFNNNKPNNNKPIIVIDEQPSPVIIQKPQKPGVVVEKPEKPIIVEEKPHKPAVVVQKPLLPTKPILVEDVPAKPVVVVSKPTVLHVPKPDVIIGHPAKPIVLVQKPSKPQVVVTIENDPEHHPIGESTASAFATAVSGTTGTVSGSNVSVGSTGSTVIASGSSGAIAVAGADSGSSVATATAGASSGSSTSHGGYPAGYHTGTETGSHADAGAHASAGSSTTNIESHTGTASEAYAGAESSAINTGSNVETESGSYAGAGSSAINTGSHIGTGSYAGAGAESYVESAGDSHAAAAAGAAATDHGVYAGAGTSASGSTTAIGGNTGKITNTIIYTNDEAVLPILKSDFNGQAEYTKENTIKTEAQDIQKDQ